MKTVLTLLLLSATCLGALAQDFEGVIHFTKTKGEKVTNYKYYVRDSNMRVEELDASGNVKSILLVDTETNTVLALNVGRKMYMDAYNNRVSIPPGCRTTRTEATKTISGYECTEVRVRSEEDDTEITYWVGGTEFSFFPDALTTINRKDRIMKYYRTIENPGPVFPFLGEERSLDGTLRAKMEVTKVEAKDLDGTLFEIPEGYTEFEN